MRISPLSNYLSQLFRSFSDTAFYAGLWHKKISNSIYFFLIFYGLLSCLMSLLFVKQELPHYVGLIRHANIEATNYFADDVSLEWDGENLLLQGRDYFEIFYPSFIDSKKEHLPERIAIIVADEKTAEDYYQQVANTAPKVSTMFFFNKNDYYLQNNQGEWQKNSLQEIFPASGKYALNKARLREITTNFIEPSLISLENAQIISFIIISLIMMGKGFLIAIWNGFLGNIILRFYKLKMPFEKSFAWSLHLTVVAQIIDLIGQSIYKDGSVVLFNLSYWAIFTFLIISLKKELTSQQKKA